MTFELEKSHSEQRKEFLKITMGEMIKGDGHFDILEQYAPSVTQFHLEGEMKVVEILVGVTSIEGEITRITLRAESTFIWRESKGVWSISSIRNDLTYSYSTIDI